MANLIERHAEKIVGVLSCFDRLVLQGTLPNVAYPQAVATELDRRDIRFFDCAKQFVLPFREAIRRRTEKLAAQEGWRSSTSSASRASPRKIAFSVQLLSSIDDPTPGVKALVEDLRSCRSARTSLSRLQPLRRRGSIVVRGPLPQRVPDPRLAQPQRRG
jgi:hypothetical protein